MRNTIKIRGISRYRDGGSPAVRFTTYNDSLETFGLPNIAMDSLPDGRPVYEVWRHCKSMEYFYGDINGQEIKLDKDHELIKAVHDRLIEERAIMVAPIDIFCDGL